MMKFSTFNNDIENTYDNILYSEYKFLLDAIFNYKNKAFISEEIDTSNLRITKPLLNLLQTTDRHIDGYNQILIKSLKTQQQSAALRIDASYKPLLLKLRNIKSTFNYDLNVYFGLLVLNDEFLTQDKLTLNNKEMIFSYLDFFNYNVNRTSLITTYIKHEQLKKIAETSIAGFIKSTQRKNILSNLPIEVTVDDLTTAFLTFLSVNNYELTEIITRTILTDVLKITNVSTKFLNDLNYDLNNDRLYINFKKYLETQTTVNITNKILDKLKHLSKNTLVKELNRSDIIKSLNETDIMTTENNIRLKIENFLFTSGKVDLENLEYVCLQFNDNPKFFINAHYLVYLNYCINFIEYKLFDLDFSDIFDTNDLQFVYNTVEINKDNLQSCISEINKLDIINSNILLAVKKYVIPIFNSFFKSDLFLDYIIGSIKIINDKLKTYNDINVDFDVGVELLRFRIMTYIHTHDNVLNDIKYIIHQVVNQNTDKLELSDRDFYGITKPTRTSFEIDKEYDFVKSLYFSASLNLILRRILSVYKL